MSKKIIWSLEPSLGTIESGTSVNFIFTAKIEETTTSVTPGAPPVVTITDVADLVYQPVVDYELPSSVNISGTGSSISVSGDVNADALFVKLAYTENGVRILVHELDDAPIGAVFCDMVPSNNGSVAFKWNIFSESMQELINRQYTLIVRTSWTSARNTIKEVT